MFCLFREKDNYLQLSQFPDSIPVPSQGTSVSDQFLDSIPVSSQGTSEEFEDSIPVSS